MPDERRRQFELTVRGASRWLQPGGHVVSMLLTIALATLASEDLACVATALLIQQGAVEPVAAVLACALGIFVGDVGLWAVGRISGRAALPWTAGGRGSTNARAAAAESLRRHAGWAILASRFLPGTRVLLYVSAGAVRVPLLRFARWALGAALLWVPLIVFCVIVLGEAFVVTFGRAASVWLPRILAAAIIVAIFFARPWSSALVRARVVARVARWSRWEFWPAWLFYAPVAIWIGALAVKYRSLTTVTAANPGIPDGGTVGESKAAILGRLPADVTLSFAFVDRGSASQRLSALEDQVRRHGWAFPIILKPDVGQRGIGVRLAVGWNDVRQYLETVREPIVAQAYHPGPFEAGVFYYRMPAEPRGRILSITDKVFPILVGDGRSTVEWLIWNHPRYRLQGSTFARRHKASLQRVLANGERFQLALAGNHAQGTLFRDGRHLITPALERRIDEIARAYPGFFIGRFDIRYSDVEAFKAGYDIGIVELNGVTAESTNIYDPGTTLLQAYRVLFRQWAILFAIGDANRRAGATPSRARRLAALALAHLTTPVAIALSD